MAVTDFGSTFRHQDLADLGVGDPHPQYVTTAELATEFASRPAPTGATIRHGVASVTSAYPVAVDISVVLASGTFTVTLPSAAAVGREITVKNTGTGSITVASAAGNVEGAATAVLPSLHSITAVSDGGSWWVI